MTRYKCRICGATFDEPFVEDGALLCRFCANPYFDELDLFPCPVCGEDKLKGELICKPCGENLVGKFKSKLKDLDLNDIENDYLTSRICEYGLIDLLEG